MGLRLPLVYNTGGYESMKTLGELDGIISIYLPDLRYASDEWAKKYSEAPDYVAHSRAAIKEMYRQVGNLETDEYGIARKGLIVRHLVLPNRIAGSKESLTWLAQEISPAVAVGIMSQYYPTHHASEYPQLSRRISRTEYLEVVRLAEELGLDNGWLQGMRSPEHYLPDFRHKNNPFNPAAGNQK
jgi:putative pyruvate formate lyase activating enzyme